jgi:hypothetical protein
MYMALPRRGRPCSQNVLETSRVSTVALRAPIISFNDRHISLRHGLVSLVALIKLGVLLTNEDFLVEALDSSTVLVMGLETHLQSGNKTMKFGIAE